MATPIYGIELNAETGALMSEDLSKVIAACNKFKGLKFMVVNAHKRESDGTIITNPYFYNQLNVPYKMHLPCLVRLDVDYTDYGQMGKEKFLTLTKDTDPTLKIWKNLIYMASGAMRGINGFIINAGENPPVTEYWVRAVMEHLFSILSQQTKKPIWYQIPRLTLQMYTSPKGDIATWLTPVEDAAIYSEAFSGTSTVQIDSMPDVPASFAPPQPWVKSVGLWNFARTKFITNLGLGMVNIPLWQYRLGEEIFNLYMGIGTIPAGNDTGSGESGGEEPGEIEPGGNGTEEYDLNTSVHALANVIQENNILLRKLLQEVYHIDIE